MAIHLDLALPSGSSSLPEGFGRAVLERLLLGLAPDEACHATYCYQRPGGLLHRRFTLTRRGRAVCSLLRYLSGPTVTRGPVVSYTAVSPLPTGRNR